LAQDLRCAAALPRVVVRKPARRAVENLIVIGKIRRKSIRKKDCKLRVYNGRWMWFYGVPRLPDFQLLVLLRRRQWISS
jgi:hypothetical protein